MQECVIDVVELTICQKTKFAKENCYKFGKTGHVKRVCRMEPQESASNKGKKSVTWERGKHSKRANYLQEEELCEEVFTMYSIQTAQSHVPPFTQVLLVFPAFLTHLPWTPRLKSMNCFLRGIF